MKYSLVIWLFLTYLSDIALLGGVFIWGAYGLGGSIALYVATKIRQPAHKWAILIISVIIVILGASNAANAGVGGLGALLVQPFTFILIAALLVSERYENFYVPSANQIIVFFIIEVVIVLLFGLLDISFFDFNKGEAIIEYRGVKVMTGFHSGSLHLYILYVVSFLLLYEKYQKFFLRLLLLIFIGYLIYSLGSRAAILGFVAVITLLPFRRGRVFTTAIFITLLASPLIISISLDMLSNLSIATRFLESDSRLMAWSYAMNALFQNWQYIMFGSGEMHIIYDNGNKLFGLHNVYLTLLSRFGVFVYIAICALIYRQFSRTSGTVTRLSVIGLMVLYLFNGNVFSLGSIYLASLVMLIHADASKKWGAGPLKVINKNP